MKKIIALSSLLFLIMTTHAQAAAVPAWLCTMTFSGTQRGLQLLVGQFRFEGVGRLNCANPLGAHQSIPVRVELKTAIISPNVSFGVMNLYGQTAEVAIFAGQPEDLLGNYIVAQVQAAVLAGGGVYTAVKEDVPETVLRVSLHLATGFGVNVGFSKMRITLLD